MIGVNYRKTATFMLIVSNCWLKWGFLYSLVVNLALASSHRHSRTALSDEVEATRPDVDPPFSSFLSSERDHILHVIPDEVKRRSGISDIDAADCALLVIAQKCYL
ncbi:MAG: hypothetical protein ACFB15_06670 [Cyclobacteriaceae bacterium]